MVEPRRCRTGGAARVTLPAEFLFAGNLCYRSVRTIGRPPTRRRQRSSR